jgi:L-alanine-DL-glutamate epimerase-like enolase superfamily enzyme
VTDPLASVEASTAVPPLPQPLQVGSMPVAAREYSTVLVRTESGLTGTAYCLTGGNPYDPAHSLSCGRLAVADGFAVLPSAPGIGFELLEVQR